MRNLTLEQTADYLESAEIQKSVNLGYAVIHQGISEAGHSFVLLNDWQGNTVVTESA
jgi:hypothetical protein